MKTLVAIPCFNEAKTIEKVVLSIRTALEGSEIQILIVDDGSSDSSSSIALGLGCSVVSHPENKGVGAAFQTAVDFAVENNFDFLLTIDADGQFDAQDLRRISVEMVERRLGFCSGSRFTQGANRSGIPKARQFGNDILALWISSLTGKKFTDVSCGLRGYSREALLELNLYGQFTYTQEVLLDLANKGFSTGEIPIKVQYFQDRKSHVSGNLFRYAMRSSSIIFRAYRDYYPLRFFWTLAAFLFLGSVFFAAIFLENYFRTGEFEGGIYAAFISAFLFTISFALWFAGLMADLVDILRRNQERMLKRLKTLASNQSRVEGNKL